MSSPTDLERARDPATPASRLHALATHDDEAVCLAVAANPSTTYAIVNAMLRDSIVLSNELAASILGNPSLPFWLLHDPSWLQEQDRMLARTLASSPALTPLGWEALQGHESSWVRVALLDSAAAPPEAWRRLGFSSEPDILLERICHDPGSHLRPSTLQAISDHPEFPHLLRTQPGRFIEMSCTTALAMARSPSLTPELWQALREQPEADVRLALLHSPLAPPDAWTRLGLPSEGTWDLSNARLASHDIMALGARSELGALTGLNLTGNDLGDDGVEALTRSPFLDRLTSLELSRCQVSQRGVLAISQAPLLRGLTSLDLSRNELHQAAPAVLARLGSLARLVHLDLTSHPLTVDHLGALSSRGGFPSLRSLDLSFCELSHLGRPGVGALSQWLSQARLASLDLGGNHLGDEALLSLLSAGSLASLTSLKLSCNELTVTSARALADTSPRVPLTTMGLSSNQLGDAGLAALVSASLFPDLAELSLYQTGLGPTGMKALARSRAFPLLGYLDLSLNQLGDEGLLALSQATALGNLRRLSLRTTGMGLDGMGALASSRAFPLLNTLDLRMNPTIDDRVLMALVRSTTLRHLTALGLGQTLVSDDGLEALARSDTFQHLERLILDNLSISDKGLMALARSRSLPRLRTLNLHECDNLTDEGVLVLSETPLFSSLAKLHVPVRSRRARDALRVAAARVPGLQLSMSG